MMKHFGLAVALAVGVAEGAEIIVGKAMVATNDVSAGATVEQAEVVRVAPEGTICKTGGGTLRMSTGVFNQTAPVDYQVQQGAIELTTADAQTRCDVSCPTEVMTQKALLWVDASLRVTRPELFQTVNSNGVEYVEKWYDVRETNPSAPTYLHAEADYEGHIQQGSVADQDPVLRPEFAARENGTAVYFGGIGSAIGNGRRMWWRRPNGTIYPETAETRHVFAVTEIVDSSGGIFGDKTFNYWGSYWGTATTSLNYPILSCDNLNAFSWLRAYRNGEAYDPLKYDTAGLPKKGFQVLEYGTGPHKGTARAFFYNSGATEAGSVKNHVKKGGGDYLYEAIVFTNELTEVERERVHAYLQNKWMKNLAEPTTFTLAEGATVSIRAGTGDGLVREEFRGDGVVTKKGADELTLADVSQDVFTGRGGLRVTEGAVNLRRQVPIVAQGGDRISVAGGRNLPQLSIEANAVPSDTIEKTGDNTARLTAIPEGVNKVSVQAGTLVLASPERGGRLAPGETVVVDIPNHSFEERADADKAAWGKQPGEGATYCGWRCDVKNVFFYNRAQWVKLGCKGANGADISAWSIHNKPVPDGESAMLIQGGGTASTAIEVPVAGEYTLTYWENCRAAAAGHILTFSLVDEQNGVTNTFAQQVTFNAELTSFAQRAIRVQVPYAGAWRLVLAGSGNGQDVSSVIDDIRMYRSGPLEVGDDVWPVPNGDFEFVKWGSKSQGLFCTTNVVPGWTFTQSEGWVTNTRAWVGVANRRMGSSDSQAYYHDVRRPFGNVAVKFDTKNGTKAETTFTPPKGVWYLAFDVAEGGQYNGSLAVNAVVGGESKKLTTCSGQGKMFRTHRSSVPLVTDGETAVSLTFTYAHGGSVSTGCKRDAMWLDNVRLVKFPADEEILKNGGFESGLDYWETAKGVGGVQGNTCKYTDHPREYSADVYGGNRVGLIRDDTCLWQQAQLDPGWYRFQFRCHQRTEQPATPLKVLLANRETAETNCLGRTDGTLPEKSFTNFVQYAYAFRVDGDAPVNMSVGVKGTYGEKHSDRDAILDGFSLRRLSADDVPEGPLALPRDLELSLAKGSNIQLQYYGTNEISRLRLGGRSVCGVISAETHPDYVSGTGSLYVKPHGFGVLIR